jgi:STE24 endopeptidase
MRIAVVTLFVLVFLADGFARAQGDPGTSAAPTVRAASGHPSAERVPVPEPSDKALSYYRTGTILWVVDNLWGLLVPAVLLFTGFSARIRTWAARLGRRWFSTIGLYFVAFSVVTFVAGLPLAYYEGFVREHAYGLSNQTFGKWTRDTFLQLLVGTIVGVLFLWVPYLLLKKSPRRWWLYTGLAVVPFLVLMILVQPIWIDPLFNKFGPMKDKALEAQILALADRSGIEGGRVYAVAKSEDTKALNAYVTGFGTTKRIVLWDTTIARLDREELLFVMGHEMGHYVLGHVWQLIGFFSLLTMVTLYAIHLTAGWLIARYRDRIGFSELADIASLPLVLLLFGLYGLVITPAALSFTRHAEHEADRFGLEITRNNHAAATAFVKLQTDNLAVPRPNRLMVLFRASHPPLGDRIDFSNEYRPWESGEPLAYGHLFKAAPGR